MDVASDEDIQLGPKIPEEEEANSTVRKALTEDGKLVAVKEMDVPMEQKDTAFAYLKELQELSRHEHENIVQFRPSLHQFQKVDNVCLLRLKIVWDFIRYDTLKRRYTDFELSEKQVGLYAQQILRGIRHLHENRIVHRNIRCANIWVDDKGVIKLPNLGSLKELRDQKTNSIVGHPRWMAPEIAASKSYQTPVDIWSLGCTILEMLSRKRPWFDSSGNKIDKTQVIISLQNSQSPYIPPSFSEDAKEILRMCFRLTPEERPTAHQLLEYRFVNPPAKTSRIAVHDQPDQEESTLVSPKCVETMLESQHQEGVKHVCCSLSKELEENADELTVFMISNQWLIKWQSDDDQLYENFFSFGYLRTFETDTYTCFENILDTSDGSCFAYAQSQTLKTDSDGIKIRNKANRVATDAITQNDSPNPVATYHNSISGYTRENPPYTESSPSVEDNSSGGTGYDHGINEISAGSGPMSSEKDGGSAEYSYKSNNFGRSGTSTCAEDCFGIPLQVIREKDRGESASNSNSRVEAVAVMKHESEYGKFKVNLAISCCVRGDQLCIKLRCLRGEIFDFKMGTALRQTRLPISVVVDDQPVILTSVHPDNDEIRICSKGKAVWDYKHGKQGNTIYGIFAPSAQVMGTGGSLGEIGVRNNPSVPVEICKRGEDLGLVMLKVGQKGCSHFDFQKVLVLDRHLGNTWLARQEKDITCVDAVADSNPVILTGNIDPGTSSDSDGTTQRSRFLEIRCCAQLDFAVVQESAKLGCKLNNEIYHKGQRKEKSISLCDNHIIFKGVI